MLTLGQARSTFDVELKLGVGGAASDVSLEATGGVLRHRGCEKLNCLATHNNYVQSTPYTAANARNKLIITNGHVGWSK